MNRAGAMRHRIAIQVRSTTQTPSGQPAFVWTNLAEVAAAVEPLMGGREILASSERQARIPTRFRIRYLAGVLPKMRIVWDSRWFDISEVQQPRGIKHELVIWTEELVDVPTAGG